jgi:hypothetical protein
MNNNNFEKKYADLLERFDNVFETEENYIRWANEIKLDMPNAENVDTTFELHRRRQDERTNNLVRMAIKEFLLND